jgi:hypothetical protein
MTSRSEVHHANHYTIESSHKKGQIFHVESNNVLLFCEVKIKMYVCFILEIFPTYITYLLLATARLLERRE